MLKLENGRSTPGCFTAQSAIRPSLLRRLVAPWWNKYAMQLRVTLHACKGNAPVNVKEKYVFVQAIKRGHECVYVRVSSLNKSPVQSYLCVCNGSAPGSAIKEALRDVWVCLCTRKIKGRHGCVYVCVSGIITLPSYEKSRVSLGVCMYGIITLPSTATCVCMYVYVC